MELYFRTVNITLDIFCTFVSVTLMVYLLCQPDRGKRLNLTFICLCLCNVGMLLGDLPNWLCEGFARPWFPAALRAGCMVQFLSGVGEPLLYTAYLSAYLAPKKRLDRRYLCVVGLLGAAAVTLVLLNPWTGLFYYIDGANVYHRGRGWWLSQAIPVAVLILDMAMVLRCRRFMTRRTVVTFLAYQFLPLPAILVQGFFYGLSCTYPATTFSILIIFLNIQSEQALLLEQQRREMAEAHVAVMLSQIQPHFLYNALTVVEYLCESDPPKAKAAVASFARYLRGNMRALTQRDPIPFQEELRHLDSYLALERLRFEDKLRIELEVGPQDFFLPALSVQPIVENAIKHGVTCRKAGGTVTLRTFETESAYLVTITDDGVGFNPGDLGEDREHVGITNVRNRLEAMCGGTLEIHSVPGRGTLATITLPKAGQAAAPRPGTPLLSSGRRSP